MAARESKGRTPPASVEEVKKLAESGKTPPLLLLLGDEGQRSEAMHALLRVLVPEGTEAFSFERFDGRSTSWAEVTASVRQIAMLADRRVVAVDDAPRVAGEWDDLLRFAEKPPRGSFLILSGESWDAKKEPAKTLRAKARVFQFGEPGARDLDAVFRETLQALGKEIAPEARARLAELVGDSRARVRSELEKAALVAGERKRIEVEDVMGSLARSRGHEVWGLTSAIERRDRDRALAELHLLLDDGASEIYLVAMIEWAMRRLLQARLLAGERLPESEVLQRVRVWRDQEGFLAAARSRSRDDFRLAFRRLRETDLHLKSLQVEPSVLLDLLVVDLCGTPVSSS